MARRGALGEGGGIIVEDIALTIEGRAVLAPLSLHLRERRIGIVGRNGSGKTSLLRVIAGLQEPDQGRVQVDGVDMARDRAGAIRKLGILFQNPDHQIIFPTVEEEIAFGIRQLGAARDAAREQARAVLERHGRADWGARPTHALSQGQRHYLCLMAVLAMEPAVILLDEPFTGLDLPTTMQLHRALEALGQQLVMVTHDPARLNGFDRVLWLEEGRLQADGPAAPVLAAYVERMNALGGEAPCWQ
ncbi:MAG: ABC transporter ATP-binding protein [Pararhodobacter sp.]|nr:ABC transporter ATP-binding protein [Pararhodobacter sp.]